MCVDEYNRNSKSPPQSLAVPTDIDGHDEVRYTNEIILVLHRKILPWVVAVGKKLKRATIRLRSLGHAWVVPDSLSVPKMCTKPNNTAEYLFERQSPSLGPSLLINLAQQGSRNHSRSGSCQVLKGFRHRIDGHQSNKVHNER